ncbi:MAG TPA: SDR family oxidoreductase [Acidimicrobiia bacterium]|nr:SDR family oxidoreductase [Acidimicrobiia bacterium]
MELAGRVALITGGGRGIGRAIALALADGGADVAVGYRRDEEAAAATVKEIEALGRRAGAYPADVGDSAEVEAMVASAVADFGFVDILVNNAGIASRGRAVADTDSDEVERLLRTHAVGAHAACRAVLPSMRTRPRGDIVMISSIITRDAPANGAPYAMAKAALEMLAFTLAREERRHGIHVNVVAPGLVETAMGRRLAKATFGTDDMRALDAAFPFGRVCSPEDVAGVVRFAVSPAAGYMTGQVLRVDGGGGESVVKED